MNICCLEAFMLGIRTLDWFSLASIRFHFYLDCFKMTHWGLRLSWMESLHVVVAPKHADVGRKPFADSLRDLVRAFRRHLYLPGSFPPQCPSSISLTPCLPPGPAAPRFAPSSSEGLVGNWRRSGRWSVTRENWALVLASALFCLVV